MLPPHPSAARRVQLTTTVHIVCQTVRAAGCIARRVVPTRAPVPMAPNTLETLAQALHRLQRAAIRDAFGLPPM